MLLQPVCDFLNFPEVLEPIGWGGGGLGGGSWGFFTQIKYLDVKIFGSPISPTLEHWLEQT